MATVLTMTTGMDLKVERIRERVTARAIARAMNVSHQRVGQIEAAGVVTATTADRYRLALRQVTTPVENAAVA